MRGMRFANCCWIQPVLSHEPSQPAQLVGANPPVDDDQRHRRGAAVPGGAEHACSARPGPSSRTASCGSVREARSPAAEIAKGTAAERAGLRRGDILLQIGDREIERVEDVVDVLHTSRRGRTLRYLVMREQAQQQAAIEVAPVPSSPLGALFRAGGGRRVLAAGRRVGAAAPSRSPGDAALLLADGRVFRRDGVLVHRQARRARLDVLLGRPDGDAPAAAALPALRARVPGSPRRAGCAAIPGARS